MARICIFEKTNCISISSLQLYICARKILSMENFWHVYWLINLLCPPSKHFRKKNLSSSSVFFLSSALPLHVGCNLSAQGTSWSSYGNHLQQPETGHLQVIQSVKGWMTRQIFLADQNQHVSKPTWVKLQCNRHSRSALKSVLRWQNWHSLKNVFKRAEPDRPFIWRITSQVWWLVNGQALIVDRFLPGFTESVPIFGTPHNHWHIPKVVHKRWEWI